MKMKCTYCFVQWLCWEFHFKGLILWCYSLATRHYKKFNCKLNLPFQAEEGLSSLSRCSQCGPNEAGSPVNRAEKIREKENGNIWISPCVWTWTRERKGSSEMNSGRDRGILCQSDIVCVCVCLRMPLCFTDSDRPFHTAVFVSRHLGYFIWWHHFHSLLFYHVYNNPLPHTEKTHPVF